MHFYLSVAGFAMKGWHHCCVHWKFLTSQTFHHWYLSLIWQHWCQLTQKDSPLLWNHLMTKLQQYQILFCTSGGNTRDEPRRIIYFLALINTQGSTNMHESLSTISEKVEANK